MMAMATMRKLGVVHKEVGGHLIPYNLQSPCVRKLEVIWPDVCALPRGSLWFDRTVIQWVHAICRIELFWQLKIQIRIMTARSYSLVTEAIVEKKHLMEFKNLFFNVIYLWVWTQVKNGPMQNLLPAFLLRFHISVLKNAKTGQLSSERLCQIWADNLTKFQMVVSPPFAPQQQAWK